jgi:hypothetical protein
MLAAVLRMLVAAALLCVVSYAVWWVLDDLLGRALWAQVIAVGGGVTAGTVVYGAAVWVLGVPEARQIWNLLGGRFRRTGR